MYDILTLSSLTEDERRTDAASNEDNQRLTLSDFQKLMRHYQPNRGKLNSNLSYTILWQFDPFLHVCLIYSYIYINTYNIIKLMSTQLSQRWCACLRHYLMTVISDNICTSKLSLEKLSSLSMK